MISDLHVLCSKINPGKGNLELEFQEGSVDSLEEGVEITTTKSSSWSLGGSLSLDVKATVGNGVVKKTLGYGFTASVSYTSETAHCKFHCYLTKY